jgi:hypothetical protein
MAMTPIISTDQLGVEDRTLAPGVRLRITNIPTIVRTGGHEPGVRVYYTVATVQQLERLRELARLRMADGQSDIVLDFGEDATLGRDSLRARGKDARERARRQYGQRMRRVPRFGSSDYYYERLHPVSSPRARGENRPG